MSSFTTDIDAEFDVPTLESFITDSPDSDDDDFDLPVLDLFKRISESEEDILLHDHGYTKIREEDKLCDTLQGELYRAQQIHSMTNVAIKKVCKQLANDKIAEKDGSTFCVDEDIVKESIILRHLTADDNLISNYLPKFIDFFESDTHYYMISELVQGISLKQFVNIAHQKIKYGRLNIKEYQKLSKFIMWQLTVTLYFLHNIYQCAHLDLNLENIMLENVRFIQHKDGSIGLPAAISVKVCDFGVAELFNGDASKSDDFQVYKHGLNCDNEGYLAPKVFDGDYYDARAADMWSLGMIFYQITTGRPLYLPKDMGLVKKNGYYALHNNQLKKYLKVTNLSTYFKKPSFELLSNLLNMDESNRINATNAIHCQYFKSYFKKYSAKITLKMDDDIQRLNRLRNIDLPYYH